MKHTPAPWRASIDRARDLRQITIPIGRSDQTTIARVTGPMNPDEADANAHLMAAAPQMYQALLDAANALAARPLSIPHDAQELRVRSQVSAALLAANPDLIGWDSSGPALSDLASGGMAHDAKTGEVEELSIAEQYDAQWEAVLEEERQDAAFRATQHGTARKLIEHRLLEEAKADGEDEMPHHTIQWTGEGQIVGALVHITGGNCLRAVFECRSPTFKPIGVCFE